MRESFRRRIRASRAGVWLLALLLFRAYVPAGFMPASGVPFALELCPATTMAMPGHLHHHPGTHADFESCPFGSAPAAGPISHLIEFASAGLAPVARIAALDSFAPALRARCFTGLHVTRRLTTRAAPQGRRTVSAHIRMQWEICRSRNLAGTV